MARPPELPQRKSPAFRQGLPYSRFTFELSVHIRGVTRLLAVPFTLVARILLLLTGLLTAALLLAGLLTRVLILLARFLVRVAHLMISLVQRSPGQRAEPGIDCAGTPVPAGSLRGKAASAL
jgi:hypothetical protein